MPSKRKLASTKHDKERDRLRRLQRAQSVVGRDIAPLPKVVDAARRKACERDFRRFAETYFPAIFYWPFSAAHLRVIEKIERAVLEGGLFAMAMPRGSGKTVLGETAALWAVLYGHREFVVLIGAAEDKGAGQLLESIYVELTENELLEADFPEACYPIRRLERIHQRARGQLCNDKPTLIHVTAKELVLPTIEGSPSSGAVIQVRGLTAQIRGLKHKRADGKAIRPSLVLIDDPQTDESAMSPTQCAEREALIAGTVLGLGGPDKQIAGLMTLTVMRRDDLADRLLDISRYPQWQGERTKLLLSEPTRKDLWEEYGKFWRDGLREGRGIAEATAYYVANREAMDTGAEAGWPERHHPDELSALQHAMNLRLERGEAAFAAEYQNQPIESASMLAPTLSAETVLSRCNHRPRGASPAACSMQTCFVDVHARVLYWLVVAWEEDFTGYVIDYGTEPEQSIAYFTQATAPRALPAADEASIYGGLRRAIDSLLARYQLNRVAIDAGWGLMTPVVYRFCAETPGRNILPSHGRYVGASSIPFREHHYRPGTRAGLNWTVGPSAARDGRVLMFDANYWKSFVSRALSAPMGQRGGLTIFGEPELHRLLADHLTAEHAVETTARGRTVDEWKMLRPGQDNHWLDCLVGCAVLASVEGATVGGETKPVARLSLRDQYDAAKRASNAGAWRLRNAANA